MLYNPLVVVGVKETVCSVNPFVESNVLHREGLAMY